MLITERASTVFIAFKRVGQYRYQDGILLTQKGVSAARAAYRWPSKLSIREALNLVKRSSGELIADRW